MKLTVTGLFLLIIGLTMSARADTGLNEASSSASTSSTTWILPSDQIGYWSTATNWSNGLPTGGGDAIIANGGTATVTSSGQVCSKLALGQSSGSGTVRMTGGSLTATEQYVGDTNTGVFDQSNGTNTFGPGNLYLGYSSDATGTYGLSGNAQLLVNNGGYTSDTGEYIGYSGTGRFTQSGASSNYFSRRSLYLGYSSGGNGTYELSDTASLFGDRIYVGYSGTGTFIQSGGTVGNTSTGSGFFLGYNSGSSGTYTLSGTGKISFSQEYIGCSGVGEFIHSGGTNTFSGNLFLGYQAGGSGTYRLSGTGQLSAGEEYVGYDAGATATFQQTGGSNTTRYVSIGPGGRYLLSGGTLNISSGYGGISNRGIFDGGNGLATLLVSANNIVDFSHGTFTNVKSMTVSMAANTLLIVPAGFNPSTDFKSFSSQGIVHTAGTPLVVPAGKSFAGQGSIDDPVICQGTIGGGVYGLPLYLNNGLVVSGAGSVGLDTGSLTVNDATSGMTSGSFRGGMYVGRGGTGTFTQSGGSANADSLYLGYNAADSGTYILSGSGQLSLPPYANSIYVGYSGRGTFTQSTGKVGAQVFLGFNPGSVAIYNLNGTADISCYVRYVGYAGTGTVNQSGGTNSSAGNDMIIGSTAGSHGTYNLSGSGVVSFWQVTVGNGGEGTFIQSGGTNSITGSGASLVVSRGGSGAYYLSGTGQLSAPAESIGSSGPGIFTQTGGINSAGSLTLGQYSAGSGVYTLSGGTLIVSSMSKGSGTATFNFNGGTLRASKSFSSSLSIGVNTGSGNATIDTAGYSVTLSGSLSGPGNLLKLGGGTLNLSGTNSYGGETKVLAGTLKPTTAGSVSSSSLITVTDDGIFDVSAISGGYHVRTNQTLAGDGSVTGNIVIDDGGRLAPGRGLGGLRLTGDLSLLPGTLLEFTLGQTLTSDTVLMQSNRLTLNGLQLLDFTFTTVDGFGPGKYTLIDAGDIQGSGLGANTSGVINGLGATLSLGGSDGHDLVLSVVPEPPTVGLLLLGAAALLVVQMRKIRSMRRLLMATAVLLCPLAAVSHALSGVRYTLTDLGATKNPRGMNEHGEIAGISFNPSSDNSRAFLYSNGTITTLGMLSGYTYSCTASAINDSGVVVGYSNAYPVYGGPVRGFVYRDGTMTALGTLGGTKSEAHGINNRDQIVGTATTLNDSAKHAFLCTNGVMTDLGTLGGSTSVATGINENAQVVGYSWTTANKSHAFFYDGGTMTDLGTFGGSYSHASAINDGGSVVGFAYLPGDAAYHAFVYRDGDKTDLGTFGGTYSGARAINSQGQVVGYSQVPGNQAHAFLYENGTMTDLNTLIDPSLGFMLFGAEAINDSGQIAAYGKYAPYTGSAVYTVLLTPVPEPSVVALLTIGTISSLVPAWRRLRRRDHRQVP